VKSTQPILLAFYPDTVAGPMVLRELRRRGLRRSVAVQRSESGTLSTIGNRSFLRRGVIVSSAVAIALLVGLAMMELTPSRGMKADGSVGALLVVVAIMVAWLLFRWLDVGLEQRLLARYQPWVMPGESLVLVSLPSQQAREVLDLLRREEYPQPTAFVVRAPIGAPRAAPRQLRRERFSTEQVKRHAQHLAHRQQITSRTGHAHSLWKRVREIDRTIDSITADLKDAAQREQSISLAAEWLLDNAYLVQRHVGDVQRNLSKNLYDALPVLENNAHAGEPRVFVLASEFVRSTDAQVYEQDIVDFLSAYQEIAPLTMAELWAMPLMLRVALVETLSDRALEIDERQHEHERADLWASRLVNAARRDPDQLLFALAQVAREEPNPSPYLVDHLISQLVGEPTALESARAWLEHKMGAPIAEVIQHEQRDHASDQVTLANAIGSLRQLSHLDWRVTFERVSLVDRVLSNDPQGIYDQMDFATRDRYRHVVEEIALGSKTSEILVAQQAVEAARQGNAGDITSHVGYFLVDAGRVALEERVGYRPPPLHRVRRWVRKNSTPLYLGSVVVLTLGFMAILVVLLRYRGVTADAGPALTFALLLSVLLASELAVQITGLLSSLLLPPHPLSKLALADGIPDEWRTLVVVPVLMDTPDSVRHSLDRLEIRYLANQDPNLHFALLADLPDGARQEMPEDAALMSTAVEGTEALNERYGGSPFALFYRRRRWSESEQIWMGWERKRGKLEDLNRLLVGGSVAENQGDADQATSMLRHVGEPERLTSFRSVITLDDDTDLPRGAAKSMIATLAHPLNRPRLAADGQTVDGGYTIIQPRVNTALPSATATRFSRIFTDARGTDPYSLAVSDVYQDLFGEGSYHGKGIYDVQMFHHVLNRRFPEESILSHDLLEGAYVRTGFASDIEVFDSFPSSFRAYSRRQHRWVRGDWQIAEWCAPRVPTGDGWVVNPLSLINRWKIFDNLRRSLIPAASFALLLLGWIFIPQAAPVWSGLVVGVLSISAVLQLMFWLPGQSFAALAAWRGWRGWREIAPAWMRAGLSAAAMPQQAAINLDAIARVIFRRLISRRHLLEWKTTQTRHANTARYEHRLAARTALISLMSGVVMLLLARSYPTALWSAAPFLILWSCSPAIFAWLDLRPQQQPARAMRAVEQRALRQLARQTWRFFDDLVGLESNWLPPDNYQVALRVEAARRTSPTNIGLGLLSSLTANDFGYVTLEDLVKRGLATLETVQGLEKFEGHILNWYDTGTLEPLYPRYVSTVDSGNLLASLLVAAQGYQDALERPVIGPQALEGMADTLGLLGESVKNEMRLGDASGRVAELLVSIEALCTDPSSLLADLISRIRSLALPVTELMEVIKLEEDAKASPLRRADESLLGPSADTRQPQSGYWSRELKSQIDAWLEVIDRYLPGLAPLEFDDASQTGDRRDPAGSPWRAWNVAPSLRMLATEAVFASTNGGASHAQTEHSPQFTGNGQGDCSDRGSGAQAEARALLTRAERLISLCNELADRMNMRFLYDAERRLFAVGFNVETRRLDGSYYDLLASESRTASFVAIARGEVPVEHWQALQRKFGVNDGRRVLLSWSGTMFEYLMPLLIMRSFTNSLLDDGCRQAVQAQIDFAARRKVPWGISEAAFSAVDAHRIYQYQAFGVPGLGIQRGLEDNLVVAPYATALALVIDPRAAVQNLRCLNESGLRGNYGYYDSIDYTRRRQTEGQAGLIAYTYMAHHQGMILVAIGNVLLDNIMQTRFHADPRVRATEPVLFERIPVAPVLVESRNAELELPTLRPEVTSDRLSRVTTPDSPTPRTQLLGNSMYSVMVTSAGGGFSRWNGIDLSRWHADTTLDALGSFCYVKDREQGIVWSSAHQPVQQSASRYAVTFTADRAEFDRRDAEIGTLTEIAVSLEDAAELRRITLVNYSAQVRHLELTSYTELALAPHNADLAHPAFSKLFVKTEFLPQRNTLLAWRKNRSPHDASVWAAHVLALPATAEQGRDPVQFETDRAVFLGRGHTPANPVALEGALSNSAGWVLDPIFSLRWPVSLAPGERVQLVFITCAAETRDGVLALADKYEDIHAANRAFDLSRAQALLEPRQLRIAIGDIQLYQQLASHMVFPNARLRAADRLIRRNHLGQDRLWTHGISGDLPIMVVTIEDAHDLVLVRELLTAHTYWHLRGFETDLVILNEEAASYDRPLAEELKKLIQLHEQYTPTDQHGGIFLRSVDHLSREDLTLLLSSARVSLVAARGTLVQQLAAPAEAPRWPAQPAAPRPPKEEPSAPLPFMELPYFNGLGGFTTDGKEYAIYLGPGSRTPAPWINVMANPDFGYLVSESGSGFCWRGNSQNNRLLPWSNDPISDPPGDVIYIRDDDLGIFWTATAAPIREQDAYRARHGHGYTVFEHNSHSLEQELVTFVPLDEAGGVPVRVQRLRLRNGSSRHRRLTVVTYAEWVLGEHRDQTQMHIVTNWDAESQALFARNTFHPETGDKIAFVGSIPRATSFTADRTEFLGRNGSLVRPAALLRRSLSGRSGAGLDPCASLQVSVEMEPGEEVEVTFCLGQADDVAHARDLLRRFASTDQVEMALQATQDWWDQLLETIQVETPDLAVNFMLNRWLLYQTLSCRVWGRSGFYQSGGAIGFRDQLQDAMALVYAAPDISRKQILTAAGRQFLEGDVQHWWHPQSGAGVRTRISDDLLWLPYVTTHYVRVTGDHQILDEVVPFLEASPLEEHEHERYFVPTISMEHGSLREHCHKAIARGLTAGPHGLPRIGTGDWNDGMNLVGAGGQGESVWLAWFLIDLLHGFADLCDQSGSSERASWYREEAQRLIAAVEAEAWDGQWYRRAYFDDGTPVGSKENREDRIDSIAQSWGVISGAADPDRARQALEAVEAFLVREREKMILLFAPPFEHSDHDPGYLMAYPPGVRENGGQYTHGALWVALALARQRDGAGAVRLLRMLNPVEHARTPQDVERYKVEPYVVAADVYALDGQVGRGGWTWYTGSSGWMYRIWIEDVLGFKLTGDQLTIDPVIPADWPSFRIHFRYKTTEYEIAVENPMAAGCGVLWIALDGTRIDDQRIPLRNDGERHSVVVRLGNQDPGESREIESRP